MQTAKQLIEEQIKQWREKRKHTLGQIDQNKESTKKANKELQTIDNVIGELERAKNSIS